MRRITRTAASAACIGLLAVATSVRAELVRPAAAADGALVEQRLGSGDPPRAGVRIQPGGGRVLVSKDVGAERWAIVRDETDGTVTGNVFLPGESTPRFVFCREIATNPSSAEITYDCRGAAQCAAAPCDPTGWTPLGEVRISATFFFPPL